MVRSKGWKGKLRNKFTEAAVQNHGYKSECIELRKNMKLLQENGTKKCGGFLLESHFVEPSRNYHNRQN